MNDLVSTPYPLGATLNSHGCNFAIYAPASSDIQLVLFDELGEHYTEHPLQHNYAHIKHTYIPDIKEGQLYGFIVTINDKAHYISDPYAQAISAPLHYTPPFDEKTSFTLPKCVVTADHFDWQDSTMPKRPREEMILCETHVKGLTQLHPDVPPRENGTYLGLVSEPMLEFYQQQNINTLQLLPIAACMHEPHLLEMDMVNYWGYNPYLFMAPDPRYAHKDAVTELKTAVRELHKAGIEVILDVVYNHTAEGGDNGLIFNLKALDPHYYLMHEEHFANFTGCGNTLNLAYQPSLNLVMDTLRFWVQNYHIDGFRFDLAATLGRYGDQFRADGGFFKAIAQDPILKDIKLIAEPWDIGPNGYQVGNFPFGWNETNDKLRDVARSFWRGDAGYLNDFATRIMGSRDLYSAANWPFKLTVNYITYHDGFTMQDLVTYKHKHNEANGENNQDGHGDNRSDNYGEEGETFNVTIKSRRERQKRNMVTSMLFAFGIPHILTADLLSHTQQGNNNAYCQDNELSWLNWELNSSQEVFRHWVAKMMKARQQYMVPFIRAFSGETRNDNRVFWRRVDGQEMNMEDWDKVSSVALHLGMNEDGDEMLYLINQSRAPARFRLPTDKQQQWQIICDTNNLHNKKLGITEKERLQLPTSMSILYFSAK